MNNNLYGGPRFKGVICPMKNIALQWLNLFLLYNPNQSRKLSYMWNSKRFGR